MKKLNIAYVHIESTKARDLIAEEYGVGCPADGHVDKKPDRCAQPQQARLSEKIIQIR